MRQNKYLIKEAKQNTNTTDTEAISDDLCVRLLNRCQDLIYSHLVNKNIKTKIFRSQWVLMSQINVDEYPFPDDIYAVNSIENVQQVNGIQLQRYFLPLKQISEKDRGVKRGYFVTRTKFCLSPVPFSNINYNIAYTRKLPTLGISYGTVQSTTPTTITLAAGFQDMTNVDDFFSVVDSNGNVLVNTDSNGNISLRVFPVSQVAGVLTVADTTGITAGMVVVPGKYATTQCQLPDELETTLIFALERLINARLSSTDLNMASAFTKEQLEEIAEMFSDNSGDSFMPPIVEYNEWA